MKMKKFFFLLILFVVNATNVYPQWEWQNPLPQGNKILDSYFLDNFNGWAVGLYGACIKTKDGGETWQHIQMPMHSNFGSVNFLNSSIGYVGDWDGNLLKTVDGGDNWNVQHIDNYANIYVFFIDQNYGWLLSSGPPTATYKIYRTSNGGTNWQSYPINTTHILNDLFFIDTSKGFVVGGFGEILMTTDSGISWTHINSPSAEFLYKIKFKNSLEGFICGHSGTLLKTIDGGINWQLSFIGSDLLWDIDFLDNNRGMIVGNDSKIYTTSNGGSTWVDKTFSSVWALRACNYLNETDCIVFGEMGNIYKSINNGDNWISKVSGDRNTIWDIMFIDFETGFTVGNAGSILKTLNRGKSWEKLNPLTNESLYSISFSDKLHGWIVGSNSILLKTTNAGLSWQLDSIPDCEDLTSVFFLNNNVGWVAGYYNKILKSVDGGETWIPQQINIGETITINSLSIIDENMGYACGIYTYYYPPKGFILKTTNGGIEWNSIKTENSVFNSIFFHNSLNGWVVGGKTLHTTDGGNNWITIGVGGGNDIFFSNSINGIIVANDALGSDIKVTIDGGETWSLQPRVTNHYLYSAYTGLNDIWATGTNGTILYTPNGGLPVELVTFIADVTDNNVLINWTTATETNNQGFEVQRKSVVGDFVTIGFVEGQGTTTEQHNYSFIDKSLSEGKYSYRLKQIDYDGGFEYSKTIEVAIHNPLKFSLSQNYPNPFNPSTKISWQSPVGGWQTLKVYDVLGNLVTTLIDEYKPAGNYEVEFKSTVGSLQLANGIYFYQLKAGSFVDTKKMILLK